MCIRDSPTTGEEAPPGTVGELWVRSDVVVVPEGSASDGDSGTPPGWFRTGDMVSADREGYLFPAGRLSDTINRGGEKFAPSEVEDVVRAHPAVRDVAAVSYTHLDVYKRQVQTRFDAGEWLALVARHAVTTAFVVPTMLYRILEHPDFSTTDLSSLVSLTLSLIHI